MNRYGFLCFYLSQKRGNEQIAFNIKKQESCYKSQIENPYRLSWAIYLKHKNSYVFDIETASHVIFFLLSPKNHPICNNNPESVLIFVAIPNGAYQFKLALTFKLFPSTNTHTPTHRKINI